MSSSPRSVLRVFGVLIVMSISTRAVTPTHPVIYITQMPIPDEVLTHTISETKMSIVSTMQSPLADPAHAGRGGALWIRYPDGSKRNLTAAAGFGGSVDANGNATGFQAASSIAVHRPYMHWSGTKAIFGMVVGAPTSAADTTVFHWQLYEITNFGQAQTPVITQVVGQPSNYNNFEACYDTQDRIIFVSDAPRAMQSQLYPQLDEYMNVPTNTGLWRLDRANGNELKQIIHTPSGAFTPFIDSAGRVLFVQWDHLSRDVSAVYDRVPFQYSATLTGPNYTNNPTDPRIETASWAAPFANGDVTFASEAANATFTLGTNANYAQFNNYPEPRNFDKTSLFAPGTLPDGVTPIINGNAINQFFPWECREDGSSHEIINHVGRHEFGGSNLRKNRNDDPNIVDPTFTQTTALDFVHVIESPTSPGTYFAVNPPELGTHMAGPIVRFNGGIAVNPSSMQVTQVSPNVFVPNTPAGQTPLSTAVNIYRNPLPLSDGNLMAVHAVVTQYDNNNGTDAQHPKSRYDFKMRMMVTSGAIMVPDLATTLATEPNVSLSYYANGTLITYSGSPLWELDPVEVVTPTKPSQLTSSIASVEQTVFDEVGVHAPTMQNYLKTRNLAMLVNRNSTRRDSADKQQPFNLKVAWSNTQTVGTTGKIYDIGWLQLFQSDAIRGFTQSSNANATPLPGRRNMPIPLHNTLNEMPTVAGAPSGAVKLGDDGSWAAIVPAGRALTWHLVDGAGTTSQVKERYWVNFAPGEIRTCAVCHGVNTQDQAGNLGVPTNKPAALYTLLNFWKSANPPGTVQHQSASAAAPKNAGTVTLSVARTGGSTGPASVNFTTANSTALAGTDYALTTGTLNWADGDTSPKPITIPLLNPSAIGGSKQFAVTLSGPTYAALGGNTTANVSINEPPFNAWLFAKLGAAANTPSGAANADPDNDGMENLLEWALGGDPMTNSHAQQPSGGLQGNYLTLSFTRDPTTTATCTVEVSDDLITWNPGSTYGPTGNQTNTAATTDITPSGRPVGFTTVRDNTPSSSGTKRFMRLRVTGP